MTESTDRATTAAPPPSSSSSLALSANLDLLRSLAVLLVLAQHLLRRSHIYQLGWAATSSLGYFGVLLFFVHTCLVLMYSMERTHEVGGRLAVSFYVRRAFRIYPLSILAVLAAVALHLGSDINGVAGLSYGPLPPLRSILAQVLLVQNLLMYPSIVNVLWSLPYELQMYSVLPYLFRWVGEKSEHSVWKMLGLWATSVPLALVQMHFTGLQRLSIFAYVPCFLPGIIAYVLPHRPRIPSFLWPGFVLLLVLIFTAHPVLETGWVLCLILGVAIPFFAEITTPWLRLTCHEIATYSYGIYISHQFSIWIAFALLLGHPLWLRMAVLFVLLVGMPVLLYHAIERPMIDLGRRVAAQWAG